MILIDEKRETAGQSFARRLTYLSTPERENAYFMVLT